MLLPSQADSILIAKFKYPHLLASGNRILFIFPFPVLQLHRNVIVVGQISLVFVLFLELDSIEEDVMLHTTVLLI